MKQATDKEAEIIQSFLRIATSKNIYVVAKNTTDNYLYSVIFSEMEDAIDGNDFDDFQLWSFERTQMDKRGEVETTLTKTFYGFSYPEWQKTGNGKEFVWVEYSDKSIKLVDTLKNLARFICKEQMNKATQQYHSDTENTES